jgi:hypothetical protein
MFSFLSAPAWTFLSLQFFSKNIWFEEIHEVILSPIFGVRIKWSRDASLNNQISILLFCLQTSRRFIFRGNLGMDRFKCWFQMME